MNFVANKLTSPGGTNAGFRSGVFFYGLDLDTTVATESPEYAYRFKSALIERTAIDLVGQSRRLPHIEIICVMSHRYELHERFSDDGYQRESHVHVLYYTRHNTSGTHKFLDSFFTNRKFRGKCLIIKV